MEDQQEASSVGLSGRGSESLSLRLLAVDLDGTVVDRSGKVHPQDREVIAALGKRGIITTILTGRLYSGTRAVAEHIGVGGPIGCVEGCHLVDASSGIDLHHGGLVGRDATVVRSLLRDHRSSTFLFADDRIIYDARSAPLLRYALSWSRESQQTEDVVDYPGWESDRGVTAVVLIGPRATVAALVGRVNTELAGAVFAASFPAGVNDTWACMLRLGSHSKGTALEWVARHHGLEPSNVVVVGDWYNDVPMFERAGRSFAMAQAPDDVKRSATDCLEASIGSGCAIAEAARRVGWL